MKALEERLGHRFAAPALLEAALTHPSYANDHGGGGGNERLEFLGDAVLGTAVAQLLYAAYPEWQEGHLTRARAALVNASALAEKARRLELGHHARLGRTEQRGGGANKERILANLFEAVIGALYLDGGLPPVLAFVEREFGAELAAGDAVHARDPKTRFQEWAHAAYQRTPRYRAESDSGIEEADDRFCVAVEIDGEVWGRGTGRTKRAAEVAAARAALGRAEAADGGPSSGPPGGAPAPSAPDPADG
ncbi:MAG TPA: ribonuclease III [Myxococcota bacterium]|nr:ribonuclease III [Myxococcota bacterium]